MIKIVAIAAESSAKRYQRGRLYVDEGGPSLILHPIECFTKAGILLELKTFFCRYVGQDVEISFVAPRNPCPEALAALAELLPEVEVHDYGRSVRVRTEGTLHLQPLKFAGRKFVNFQPPWQEFIEPMILLKSINTSDYAYPATDEEDDTDQTP